MYQTLLLDIDGTLLDFQKGEDYALHQVFQNHGYELTPEMQKVYERINRSLWDAYELGEIDRDTVIYTRFGKLFQEVGITGEDGILFEDEYQHLLGQKAFLLYVVTNGVSHTQWQRLRDSGLDKFMKRVFISGEMGSQKPQKAYFDACFAQMEQDGIDVSDTSKMLIVGDSLTSDIKGGNNAGIPTCWYNPAGKPADADVSVTIEIHSLEELYRIL